MKRASRKSNPVFESVLSQAQKKLVLASEEAANFEHKAIRGDERAAALAQFLSEHLPNGFCAAKGEAIDFSGRRTGQLDICIYDASNAAPILSSSENFLVPAESLYAVIEVKTTLTKDEAKICAAAAGKVRALRPFKLPFAASPTAGGVPLGPRCPYFVFAYSTNLTAADWAQKEYVRFRDATMCAGLGIDVIDRIVVLDRGLIRPQVASASAADGERGVFLSFYLHLMNFLMRERKRRDDIDWMAYVRRERWVRLSEPS